MSLRHEKVSPDIRFDKCCPAIQPISLFYGSGQFAATTENQVFENTFSGYIFIIEQLPSVLAHIFQAIKQIIMPMVCSKHWVKASLIGGVNANPIIFRSASLLHLLSQPR
jgi:hypothetical protein